MIGACAMAKRLAKYTKLADFRLLNGKTDTFPVDILIGNDYRGKFVSKTIRPKQILGMWLESTIWGDAILSGPIPGSDGLLDEQQSANVITVCNMLDMSPLNDEEVVDKENMIKIAKNVNSLENFGINVTNRQDQDKQAVSNYKSNVEIANQNLNDNNKLTDTERLETLGHYWDYSGKRRKFSKSSELNCKPRAIKKSMPSHIVPLNHIIYSGFSIILSLVCTSEILLQNSTFKNF